MPDLTKSLKKLQVPLFWRRRSLSPSENPKHSSGPEEERNTTRPWYTPTPLKAAGFIAGLLLLSPTYSHGQFGIDTAALLADLAKMQSFMNQYMAKPLQEINKAQQSISSYEKDVMYPLAAINQAKSSVAQFESRLNQLTNVFHTSVSSATLPQSQNLETVLLSRNASNVPGVSQQFQSVYGVVMPQNAASANVRNMTDMTDAQAQDAMKRAIEIDALADAELSAANSMGQQISQGAPGSAGIIEAEADVWIVRANAYTQSAMAELMRTRGIDIANQSKIAKLATTDNTTNNNLINGVLTHK